MQGAGNDFIVIESDSNEINWNRLAVTMCDRHFGVGADGVLLVCSSNAADIRMRVFNADGSEASACGNGTRCVVRYYAERHHAGLNGRRLRVETIAGTRDAWYYRSGSRAGQVKVAMGKPYGFSSSAVSLQSGGIGTAAVLHQSPSVCGRELELDLVSLGNSHAVHFTDEQLAGFPLNDIGLALDRQAFPSGINFEVARVITRERVEARVWEHGVGETLACGSGACAIAVAGHCRGIVEDEVRVELPGGPLTVQWAGRGEVFLTGPAQMVFNGEWADSDDHGSKTQIPIENEVLA